MCGATTAVRATSLLFLILLVGAAHGQTDIRIGYVDMKRLLDNAPQVIAGREQLDLEFRPRNEALLADEDRLEEMQDELARARNQGLTQDELFEMEREVRNLRRSIDRRREDLSEELHFRRNAEIKALSEEIEIAVQTVARRQGYDLVLSSPVAYASEAIDITDEVLFHLDQGFEFRSDRSGQ